MPRRELETDLNLATLGKAFAGGINDFRGLPRWLDANLFHGATFADLRKMVRPRVWINASDIYNRTPFVFGVTAFRCDVQRPRVLPAGECCRRVGGGARWRSRRW